MILLSDPVVVNIPVVECGEPLRDLRTVPALRLHPRAADPEGAYAHLREGLVDRLVAAQSVLPIGLRLVVVDGYRPAGRRARCHHVPPDLCPHAAGCAVDLTMQTAHGEQVWMGTEVHDARTSACHTADTAIPADARENRRILGTALSAAGLVNHPTEWWHWSYGDRYWAHVKGISAARYGLVVMPPR